MAISNFDTSELIKQHFHKKGGQYMSTIIRGGSITVDGLAPSGGGNNPTVDNLTVNGNISVGGV